MKQVTGQIHLNTGALARLSEGVVFRITGQALPRGVAQLRGNVQLEVRS
jgi:hypothetical protein